MAGAPIYGGQPIMGGPSMNIAGLPGLSGQSGMLLQMVLQPLLQQMLGPGFVPAQFLPQQSLHQQFLAQQYMAAQSQVIAGAGQQDTQLYQQAFTNAARLAGLQISPGRQLAIEAASRDFTSFTNFLALAAPDAFNAAHGIAGSARVAGTQMLMGGRYTMDPVTGRFGLSAGTTSMLAGAVAGPGGEAFRQLGLNAGHVGLMYNELATRGFLGDARGAMEQQGRMGDPRMEQASWVDRTRTQLEGVSRSVAVVREILGDAGHPDAPMAQIVEHLQALSQGGLSRLSAPQLEQTLRSLQATARVTGIDLQGLYLNLGAASGISNRAGLNVAFTPVVAEHGMIMGRAWGATFGGVGGWNMPSPEEFNRLSQQLAANAAGSPAANQIAATARLAEMGPLRDPRARALATAVRAHQTTWVDPTTGHTESIFMPGERWMEIMGGVVNPGTAALVLSQTRTNQQYTQELGQTEMALALQRGEVERELYIPLGQGLREAGFGDDQMELGALIVGETSNLLFERPDLANARRVGGAGGLAELTIERVERRLGRRLTEQERQRLAAGLRSGVGQAEEHFNVHSPGSGGLPGVLGPHSPTVQRAARAARREARRQEILGRALTGFGTQGPMSRVASVLTGMQAVGALPGGQLAAMLGFISSTDLEQRALGEAGLTEIASQFGLSPQQLLEAAPYLQDFLSEEQQDTIEALSPLLGGQGGAALMNWLGNRNQPLFQPPQPQAGPGGGPLAGGGTVTIRGTVTLTSNGQLQFTNTSGQVASPAAVTAALPFTGLGL